MRKAAKRVSSSSIIIWDISKTPGLNSKYIVLLFLLMQWLKLFSSEIQSLNAQDVLALAADNRTRINLLYNININSSSSRSRRRDEIAIVILLTGRVGRHSSEQGQRRRCSRMFQATIPFIDIPASNMEIVADDSVDIDRYAEELFYSMILPPLLSSPLLSSPPPPPPPPPSPPLPPSLPPYHPPLSPSL